MKVCLIGAKNGKRKPRLALVCRCSTRDGQIGFTTTFGGRVASKQHQYLNPCQQYQEFPSNLPSTVLSRCCLYWDDLKHVMGTKRLGIKVTLKITQIHWRQKNESCLKWGQKLNTRHKNLLFRFSIRNHFWTFAKLSKVSFGGFLSGSLSCF